VTAARKPARASATAPGKPTRARATAPRKPTRAEVAAAAGRTIPDVIAPGLAVLFCGINPGLYSAATGHHFARPGNRFWPALHLAGFTPRLIHPRQQDELPRYGLGITNLAARATARADELTAEELIEGAHLLTEKGIAYRPRWLAIVGVTAYRAAFGEPGAAIGPQERRVGPSAVWVLPNPSGLNAHFSLSRLAAQFAGLREATVMDVSSSGLGRGQIKGSRAVAGRTRLGAPVDG
jgi:double-stranded uracil-DNA glycosylase